MTFPLAKLKRLVDCLRIGITVTGFTERLCIRIKLHVTEKDGKLITLNVLTCTKCADNYCSGKNHVASRYILVSTAYRYLPSCQPRKLHLYYHNCSKLTAYTGSWAWGSLSEHCCAHHCPICGSEASVKTVSSPDACMGIVRGGEGG